MNSRAKFYQMTELTFDASGKPILPHSEGVPVYPITHIDGVAGRDSWLNAWHGSTTIDTLGTITTGTWQGTKIENAYIKYPHITIISPIKGTKQIDLGNGATLTDIGIPAWAQKAQMDFADFPAMYVGTAQIKGVSTFVQPLAGFTTGNFQDALTVGSAYPHTAAVGTDDNNGSHRRIYFGSSNFYLELDDYGHLHTNANFYSDGFIAAGGMGASGGGSGDFNLSAMWASLKNTQSDIYANDEINIAHIPGITTSGSGNVVTAIAKDTSANKIAVTKGITALTEVTSAMITSALGYTPANSSNFLPLAGGTMTGTITMSNSAGISMGGGAINNAAYITTKYVSGSDDTFKVKRYNGEDIATFKGSDHSITAAGLISTPRLVISDTSTSTHLSFSRAGMNFIYAPQNGYFGFLPNGKAPSSVDNCDLIISDNNVYPGTTADVNLGKSDKRWLSIYANALNLSGGITMSGNLGVSGDVTLGQTSDFSMSGGNLTIGGGGTLFVDDISAADESSIFINDDVALDAGLTVSDNLSVGGDASLNGSLSVVGDITIGTDLHVDSIYQKTANTPIVFGDDVHFDYATSFYDTISIYSSSNAGPATLEYNSTSKYLVVGGTDGLTHIGLSVGGGLSIDGNTFLGGDLDLNGDMTAGGSISTADLYVDNIRSYESDLIVRDPITFDEDIDIATNAKVTIGPVVIEWDATNCALYIHGTYNNRNIGVYTDGYLAAGEARS